MSVLNYSDMPLSPSEAFLRRYSIVDDNFPPYAGEDDLEESHLVIDKALLKSILLSIILNRLLRLLDEL